MKPFVIKGTKEELAKLSKITASKKNVETAKMEFKKVRKPRNWKQVWDEIEKISPPKEFKPIITKSQIKSGEPMHQDLAFQFLMK